MSSGRVKIGKLDDGTIIYLELIENLKNNSNDDEFIEEEDTSDNSNSGEFIEDTSFGLTVEKPLKELNIKEKIINLTSKIFPQQFVDKIFENSNATKISIQMGISLGSNIVLISKNGTFTITVEWEREKKI